jgi:hypothetical protein
LPRVASPNLPPQAAVSPRAVSPRAASPKGCLAKRLSRQKAVSPKGCLAKRLSRQKAASPKGCLAKRLSRQKAAEGSPPGQAPGARALPKARCRAEGANVVPNVLRARNAGSRSAAGRRQSRSRVPRGDKWGGCKAHGQAQKAHAPLATRVVRRSHPRRPWPALPDFPRPIFAPPRSVARTADCAHLTAIQICPCVHTICFAKNAFKPSKTRDEPRQERRQEFAGKSRGTRQITPK